MPRRVRAVGLGVALLAAAGCASPEPGPAPASDPPLISDTATTAEILRDADAYWANAIVNAELGLGTAAQERSWIRQQFASGGYVDFWTIGYRAASIVQMYDLVAPLDAGRAAQYLELLRVIADEVLAWRDDLRTDVAHSDDFRGAIMAAWGASDANRDYRWNTDVVIAGLLTYPMAAFARRVATNPAAFSAADRADAIRFTMAVIETYRAFQADLYLSDSSAYAYYHLPATYATLQCTSPGGTQCRGYRANAGFPIAWNENLSLLKALAEVALAADSTLYRESPDTVTKQATIVAATQEVPALVAKHVEFFVDYLELAAPVAYLTVNGTASCDRANHLREWSGDHASYYVWEMDCHAPSIVNPQTQDTSHAQFELGSLAVIFDHAAALDELLARAGRSERIRLTSAHAQRFATTFLRLIWNTDNTVGHKVDGSYDGMNWTKDTAGFVALSPFDPWVWVRARDAAFAYPGMLRYDNYAALLRYRP